MHNNRGVRDWMQPHPNHDKSMSQNQMTESPQPVAEAESLVGVTSTDLLASSGSTPIVDCDRECWVKDRIMTAIRMAASVRQEAGVRADDAALQSALDGIANGTAVEIIRTLGMEPAFVNLRRPPSVLRGRSVENSVPLG
jgi:hypothetical protein